MIYKSESHDGRVYQSDYVEQAAKAGERVRECSECGVVDMACFVTPHPMTDQPTCEKCLRAQGY